MSTINNKPLTISLQNIHTLYCKYIDQYILQHLPKTIVNEVNILLGMKSAIDAYKYLDNKLNDYNNHRKNNTTAGGSTGNINVMVVSDKDNNQKKDHSSNNNNNNNNSTISSLIDKKPYIIEDEKDR